MRSSHGRAEQAGDSAALEALARVGLVAYGVVHLLISSLALQLAWGAPASKSADPSGALSTLAGQPLGKILLWLVSVGLVALALWQASEAICGYRNREGAPRVRKQVTSRGQGRDLRDAGGQRSFGRARLGIVELTVSAARHFWCAGLVGGLLSYAALTFERQKAPGLDGTLQTILAQPFGSFLLTGVAVGFLTFGVFAMLQSRYRRM